MIACEVLDYEAAPKELAYTVCPACEWMESRDDGGRDRYGFPFSSRQCLACGHTWLTERMTAEAYAEFYASGAYRRLVSAFHGREINAETIKPEQREYARRLRRIVDTREGSRILDVGGAGGVVAQALVRGRPCVTVLDPSGEPTPGCEVIKGMAEDLPAGRRWDVILLCQTIDHLLDPAGVLERLRGALADDGRLWVDALDFDITQELKIDHPHNFTATSILRLLDRTGWQMISESRWNRHVGFLCA